MFRDKKALQDVYDDVKKSILTSPKLIELPDVGKWVKKLFDYTLEGGKRSRGCCLTFAYLTLEKPENITEEKLHTARVLGSCIEMTFFLVVDDIIDVSTTRRGKPCWYLQPNIGFAAFNDTIFIYLFIMEVLQQRFGKTPIYNDVMRIFNEAAMYITLGQNMEFLSAYNKEKNSIDLFNMDYYNTMAIHKTAHFSFNTPILLALLLVKNGNGTYTEENILIGLELGKFIQYQNDYKDIYGDESITGKAGTDIPEGKLSWLAVKALEICNEKQRAIFKEYYGSKDPEHVKHIKQLYDELHLPQEHQNNLRTVHDDLTRRIQALPTEEERKLFLELLEACRKEIF